MWTNQCYLFSWNRPFKIFERSQIIRYWQWHIDSNNQQINAQDINSDNQPDYWKTFGSYGDLFMLPSQSASGSFIPTAV
jgi:hypothetical protein